jgi:hypothetical protein
MILALVIMTSLIIRAMSTASVPSRGYAGLLSWCTPPLGHYVTVTKTR